MAVWYNGAFDSYKEEKKDKGGGIDEPFVARAVSDVWVKDEVCVFNMQ